MRQVTLYHFEEMLKYIENHKETIDIVLCGIGDDFHISYDIAHFLIVSNHFT